MSDAVLIGVGNPMRRDDGVGHAVIAALEASSAVELTALDGEPTRLIEAWRDRELAIVVDAMRSGRTPGSIERFEAGVDALPSSPTATSSHAAGITEAIELAMPLDALPGRLVVLAVEAADVSLGEGLSPAVSDAVPVLVDRVRAELAIET